MQLIDSHAHLTSPDVLPHLKEILQRAEQAQIIHIINVCTDSGSLQEGMALHRRCPWVLNAGATTPHDVDRDGEKCFSVFAAAARQKQIVAIGETGLDYYYQHSKKSTQQEFLIRYLHLATECQLPVIFHCREAFDDLFQIADQEYSKNGLAIVHCFTGSLDEVKRALDRGWMISFSGIITFKKSQSLREVVRYVPLENILIETDTPYLAPQTKRGQSNEPSFIQETANCIAAIKEISMDEVARVTTQNAKRIFFKETPPQSLFLKSD